MSSLSLPDAQVPELLPPVPSVAFNKSSGNSGLVEVEAGSSVTVNISVVCPNNGCDTTSVGVRVCARTHTCLGMHGERTQASCMRAAHTGGWLATGAIAGSARAYATAGGGCNYCSPPGVQ